MIEAFTRLDGEILAVENLSPGSRLTTAEAWVEHLEVKSSYLSKNTSVLSRDSSSLFQNMQQRIDDTISEKHPVDVVSEIDESIVDDDKSPPSATERERNDIMKVKKVCKCSFELVHSMCCLN